MEPVPKWTVSGTVVGSVTLLGNDGPANPAGRLTLHRSVDDLDLHLAAYSATLIRREGSARTYDFVMPGVTPGDYYALACFTVGCAAWRQPETGTLLLLRVTARRVTVLRFGI